MSTDMGPVTAPLFNKVTYLVGTPPTSISRISCTQSHVVLSVRYPLSIEYRYGPSLLGMCRSRARSSLWTAIPGILAGLNSPTALEFVQSFHIANDVESSPYYKPQVHTSPHEETLLIAYSRCPDGKELMYNCKFALGDPVFCTS